MVKSFFRFFNEELYVSHVFLNLNGMKKETLDKYFSRYSTGKTMNYSFFEDKHAKLKWCNYDSIPKSCLGKLNLPLSSSALIKIVKDTDFQILEKPEYSEHDFYLSQSYYNKSFWVQFIPHYRDFFTDAQSKNLYAKNHSVFSTILELKKQGKALTEVLISYNKLPKLVFKTSNYTSFARKLVLAEKNGIAETLLHDFRRYGREPYKISGTVKGIVMEFYKNPKRYSIRKIHQLTNFKLSLYNLPEISLSAVGKICQKESNRLDVIRLGGRYARNNLIPYLNRGNVDKVGELYQMDSTQLNFKYLDEEKNIKELSFCILLDVFSKKILGSAFDNSENSRMVIECLKNAFMENPLIPNEIVLDKNSSNNSVMFKRVENRLFDYGVYFRRTRVNNPQDKGHVESYFGTFQKGYLNFLFGSLGDGIKSKRKGGRAHIEVEKIYLKKGSLPTREQLINTIKTQIDSYNASPLPNSKLIPEEVFQWEMEKSVNRFKKFELSYLFGYEKELTVKQSMIVFKHNKKKYHYTIWDSMIQNKYNGQKVLIYFNEHNLSEIDVFESKTHKFVTRLRINPLISPVAKTEEEKLIFQNHYISTINLIKSNIESSYEDSAALRRELKSIPKTKILSAKERIDFENMEKEDLLLIEQVTKKYRKNKIKLPDQIHKEPYRNKRKNKIKRVKSGKISR